MRDAETNRGREWVTFAKRVLDHIEGYTVKQYGDAPNDNVETWSAQDCQKQIGKYPQRFGAKNMRGKEDNLLSCMKEAHYACLSFNKYMKENPELRGYGAEMVLVDDVNEESTPEDRMRTSSFIENFERRHTEWQQDIKPPYMWCIKCKAVTLPNIKDSGPYKQLNCHHCGQYIKHGTEQEVHLIMQEMARIDDECDGMNDI